MTNSVATTTDTMHFTKLTLSSWKNFKKVKVELAKRMFIIGANASGKSNFLEIFRFLHDLTIEGGGLAQAVSLREGMSKIRSLHATINSSVEIEVEISAGDKKKWTYELSFKKPSDASIEVQIEKERVTLYDKELLKRPDADDKGDKARLRQTSIEQVVANKPFRELADFFRSIRFMNLVPQLIREGQPSPKVFPGQDPLGRDFLQQVASCSKGDRTKRLKQIEGVLKAAVPNFENLRLETDKRGYPHLALGLKHWRPNAAKQRESQLSDGTLRLIGMLWALQENAGPLLLEEPEWSLHSSILERLAPFIARMLREGGDRQVFITTHNERILGDRGIAPEEILLIIPAKKGGSEIIQAAKKKEIKQAMEAGLTAAEIAVPQTRLKTTSSFGGRM